MVAEKARKQQEAVEILWLDGKAYASHPLFGYVALELAESQGPNFCECWGYRKHCAGTTKLCRHLRALKLSLACPICEGSGVKETQTLNPFNMALSPDSYPCPACLGEGSREGWDYVQDLAEPEPVAEEPVAVADGWSELTNEQRLEVFR